MNRSSATQSITFNPNDAFKKWPDSGTKLNVKSMREQKNEVIEQIDAFIGFLINAVTLFLCVMGFVVMIKETMTKFSKDMLRDPNEIMRALKVVYNLHMHKHEPIDVMDSMYITLALLRAVAFVGLCLCPLTALWYLVCHLVYKYGGVFWLYIPVNGLFTAAFVTNKFYNDIALQIFCFVYNRPNADPVVFQQNMFEFLSSAVTLVCVIYVFREVTGGVRRLIGHCVTKLFR